MVGIVRAFTPASLYTGPGDVASFDVFYGVRAYSGAYAAGGGNAFDLRRSSDNGTMTAAFLATGALDTATISSWAGADTIFISRAYDQTGNNRHATQPTPANQLTQLLSGGMGNKPYILVTATKFLSYATFAPSNGVCSFSTVAYRNGTNTIRFISNNGDGGNLFGGNDQATANRWMLKRTTATTTRFNAVASDSAWHVGQGIMNGASSVISIDGTDTTGSVAGDTVAATLRFASGGDGRVAEAGFDDGTAWAGAVYGALTANQQAYYA